jgi:predicted MPP superfamily phosphohydrolase
MLWMVVLFLIAVCFLVVDVVTGFGAFFPRAVQGLRSSALAAGLLISVIAFIQGHRAPVIESFDVTIPGLPTELEGKVLVALADLHYGTTMDNASLNARVKQVMAEQPDFVVLLGDVVEGDGEADEKLASTLSGLSAPLGVWGVLGNHESHGSAEKNAGRLAEAGVHVLRSERAEIRPGFFLAGVNDLSSGEKNGRTVAELTKTLQELPAGAATILLSHAPVGADFAASHGVSLMLSGHTHGGQIWPFSYLVGLRYPLRDGHYTVGGMTVIVCRGTGTWATRMRLWSPCSILRITLRRG